MFALEPYTEADHEMMYSKEHMKIISKYCIAHPTLEASKKKKWAIDSENKITFIHLAVIEPRDSSERYLMIFEGALLFIQLERRSEKVGIVNFPPELESRRGEVQQAITDAFSVHGLYGARPPEMPYEFVSPIFE